MKLVYFALMGSLALATATQAQQYYRWVDDEGVVHFSQQPPPDNSQAEQRVVPSTPLATAPAEQVAQATDDSAIVPGAEEGTGVFGRDEEMCNQVRQSLATMRENEVINMTMQDGEIVQIHGESRQAEINRLLSMQSYYC